MLIQCPYYIDDDPILFLCIAKSSRGRGGEEEGV